MTDRTDQAFLGGLAFVLVDVVANSAHILIELSAVLLPALAYMAGDLGEHIGVDQTLVTYALVFFGGLYVLGQLLKAGEKVKDHVTD